MAASLLAQQDLKCEKCPDCSICIEKLTENPPIVASVPCGHCFHKKCIGKLKINNEPFYGPMYRQYGYEFPSNAYVINCPICSA